MFMNKKFVCIISFFAIILAFTGCNQKTNNEIVTTNNTNLQSSYDNKLESASTYTTSSKNNFETTSVKSQSIETTKLNNYTKENHSKPLSTFTQESNSHTFAYTFTSSKFDEYDNETPINKKITISYDESEIVNKYLYYSYFPDYSGNPAITFNNVNKEYPVECIRKCEENIYAVYKTKQGGFMYMFFTPDMKLYYSAYSVKNLSSVDFDDIKSGDTFEDVVAIDPAAKAMKSAYEYRNNSLVFYSMHILSDGLFVIFYNVSDSGEYTVWKSAYYSDYIFNNHNFFAQIKPEYAVDNTDYSYKILTNDYVSH